VAQQCPFTVCTDTRAGSSGEPVLHYVNTAVLMSLKLSNKNNNLSEIMAAHGMSWNCEPFAADDASCGPLPPVTLRITVITTDQENGLLTTLRPDKAIRNQALLKKFW